jgi:3-keto-5-aminohexanoate cleavage enzyme
MNRHLPKAFPLSLCTTGMVPRKEQNPNVPISANEIVSQILEIYHEIGLTSVHIHARREDQSPAWERKYFERIIEGIRHSNPELVICVTTSGRDVTEFEKRSEVLEISGSLKPDLASLTLSSQNFLKTASINSPQIVRELLQKMLSKGIMPEFEIFDTGMVNVLNELVSEFEYKKRPVVNLIMGNSAGIQAGPLELGFLMERIPKNSLWSVGGIGKSQLPANALALSSEGGVRVGLEDNIYFNDQRTLATNYSLVERVRDFARLLGREIMKPNDFRDLMSN